MIDLVRVPPTLRTAFAWVSTLIVLAPAMAAPQPPGAGWTPVPPEEVAALERADRAAKPGPPHRVLASLAGRWEVEGSAWSSPTAPPARWTGTATATSTMEGRYLETELAGTLLGRSFTARSVVGFDNVAGQFAGAWWDDVGTNLLSMAGAFDETTRTFTYSGEMADLERPGGRVTVRLALRLEGPDTQVAEWFESRNGNESLAVRMICRRVPGRDARPMK